MFFVRRLQLECAQQPRNDDLFENDGIGPHFHLSPEMATLRVDLCSLGDVPFAEEQIQIGDGYLRV